MYDAYKKAVSLVKQLNTGERKRLVKLIGQLDRIRDMTWSEVKQNVETMFTLAHPSKGQSWYTETVAAFRAVGLSKPKFLEEALEDLISIHDEYDDLIAAVSPSPDNLSPAQRDKINKLRKKRAQEIKDLKGWTFGQLAKYKEKFPLK